jgi:hypothetical protein
MRLDYYTLLCPEPIQLSIGNIKHPTLRRIGKLTFQQFGMYQVYLKLTPKDYYKYLANDKLKKEWENLSDVVKLGVTLYDLITIDEVVQKQYEEMFNFFFVERVIYVDDMFLIVDTDDYETPPEELDFDELYITGVINQSTLTDVLDILQQVCCIKSDDPLDEVRPKFKNAKAKKLYDRMLKAKEQEDKKKEIKDSINLSLPNIISATASKNAGLNIVNIWDATLFQLYDQFGKVQNDDIHYMNSVRVAVWGDEKNQFDPSLWYKNNYDKEKTKVSE